MLQPETTFSTMVVEFCTLDVATPVAIRKALSATPPLGSLRVNVSLLEEVRPQSER